MPRERSATCVFALVRNARHFRWASSAAVVVALAGCQTAPVVTRPPPPPAPQIKTITLARYEASSLAQAPQLRDSDLLAAWPALLASCNAFDRSTRRERWTAACAGVRLASPNDAVAIRAVIESQFSVYRMLTETRESAGTTAEPRVLDITDRGRLTGYYERELNGSRIRSEGFSVP